MPVTIRFATVDDIPAFVEVGRPVGWIIGTMERQFYSDLPVASVIHFGVVPGRRMSGVGLRLLMAFRQWAKNRGAFELNAGVSSGVEMDRMGRFFKRLGFRLTGGNYAMMLRLDLSMAIG